MKISGGSRAGSMGSDDSDLNSGTHVHGCNAQYCLLSQSYQRGLYNN